MANQEIKVIIQVLKENYIKAFLIKFIPETRRSEWENRVSNLAS